MITPFYNFYPNIAPYIFEVFYNTTQKNDKNCEYDSLQLLFIIVFLFACWSVYVNLGLKTFLVIWL